MALLDHYYQILLILLSTIVLLYFFMTKSSKHSSIPTDWPIVRMLPSLVRNADRIHEFATDFLKESGGTFELKGPIFANMDMVVTCDPVNIHHIFIKKFSNYPKGPDFKKIFEVLGDGIFRADFGLWELHRKTTLALMNENFYTTLELYIWEKVEIGLGPILDRFCQTGSVFDMQDILGRFSFDVICRLLLNGHDPASLSPEMPNIPCEKGLNEFVGPLLRRYIVPEFVWRLEKWLNIGPERRLTEASRAFDDFIYPCISSHTGSKNDMFALFGKVYEEGENDYFSRVSKEFLRDTFLNLLIAGRDSLSTGLTWFFYLLSRNLSVEAKIREEIEKVLLTKGGESMNRRFCSLDDCDELIYLHAALCETMRLYPPIAIEQKVPLDTDLLPGRKCRVDRGKKVIVSFYALGRMESVWGEDCLEFRPERWLEPGGRGIKQEPASKFPAFNVGPRTCVGKKMAFIEMKMVASYVIHHFNVRVVEGHPVSPRSAIILKAEHGLSVKLTRK